MNIIYQTLQWETQVPPEFYLLNEEINIFAEFAGMPENGILQYQTSRQSCQKAILGQNTTQQALDHHWNKPHKSVEARLSEGNVIYEIMNLNQQSEKILKALPTEQFQQDVQTTYNLVVSKLRKVLKLPCRKPSSSSCCSSTLVVSLPEFGQTLVGN